MNALLRLAGRSIVALLVCSCALLVVVQYWRVIQHNNELSRELSSVQRDIAYLRLQHARQDGEIRRLSDPRGAIPEIHDRLRLVGKNEALMYVQGLPAQVPTASP